ncbi:DUF3857 domain-containing protein [Ideonella sp.]|uniref:DUF3857 domain-containing protein n=1 Tax=Ideonella sp. TaxID=1929293 RepID=UPI0035AE3FE5
MGKTVAAADMARGHLAGRWAHVANACLLAACGLWATAASAQAPAGTPAKARTTAAAAAKNPTGFNIAPAPAWVLPVPVDAGLVAQLPKAPLQLLVIDRQTRVEAGDETRYMRAVRQINETAGLEAGAQLQIEFDPSYQKLTLHKLELWRNGQRIDKLDARQVKLLQRESQLERQMVDGRSTASVVLSDVRVGDRVEFAYSLRGANPVFEGKFVDTDWALGVRGPTALLRYRLLAPQGRAIQVQADPSRIETNSQVQAGWRDTVMRRTLIPQFQSDANTPPAAYLPDVIQLSEYADWADVARWATRVFTPGGGAAPAVQAQADTLAGPAADAVAERVRRTLDFVQNEVRYFGTETGINSHRPADPDQVLKQRFGDCKDKVALLVALLKAQGVVATPVLVSTGFHDDVARMLPSPLAFNHVIARVQVGDQAWLLDGTRSRQTGPLAERQSFGLGQGLVVDAGTAGLSSVPDGHDTLRVAGEDRLVFTSLAEDPRLSADIVYHGDVAESVRHTLDAQPASELEKQFLDEYTRFYSGAQLDGAMQVDEVEGHNALRVRLNFKLPNYLRLVDRKTLVGDYGLPGLVQMLRLPDQVPRKLPMVLGSPGIYRHTLEFRFPEEVYTSEAKRPFDVVDPNFELHIAADFKRASARFDGELRLLNEQLKAADWSAHREQLVKLWPRLMGTVNVPTIGPKEAARLTERGKKDNAETLRVLSSRRTKVQVTAQINLWVAQAQLDSNRLTPLLRAKILTERGVQQDHLGQASEAALSFTEALKLDPSNSEAHAGLSVNALMQRQDALAIEHASKALALAPSDSGPRYTRAYAHYYAGQPEQARDELLEVLKNRADVDRGYATLWLHVVSKRLGSDGVAATQPFKPSDSKPAWPYPVVELLNGTGSLDQALAAARADKDETDGRLCELYFFLGQQQLLDGKPQVARDWFQKAVNTRVVEFVEYALAERELQKLAAR